MNNQSWIDAHCHLASDKFEGILAQVIQRSQQVGVTGWIQGGISPSDWARQKQLQDEFGKRVMTSFGLHPWWVGTATLSNIEEGLETLGKSLPEANALGELGLDFGQKHDLNRPQQMRVFKEQLILAKKHRKPLILHVVRAHREALDLIKSLAPFPDGGIVHSFTGSYEIAQAYSKLGFLISIGSAVTQEGYFSLKKSIPLLTLHQIVVETDSPDQPPRIERVGENNEPRFLIGIAEAIAQIKDTKVEAVLDQSTKNLEKLFRLN